MAVGLACFVGASLLVLLGTGVSVAADKTVQMTFSNGTDGDAELFWLDTSKGKEVSYGVVPKGKKTSLETHHGHVWIVRSTRGDELERHTVDSPDGAGVEFGLRGPQANLVRKNTRPKDTGSAIDEKDTGSAVTAQEAEELVKLHNKIRAEVGVGPVKWSPTLAKFAQAWADELARTGEFDHNPDYKYGENLWSGSGGGLNVLSCVPRWYREKEKYTPGTPGGDEAGHYTQMVWKKTTEIGVGKAVYTTGRRKGALVVVANYNPKGNTNREKPY
jgi:pathogenesis-related protein 1